jgi:23S rRNA (pseudouridine1915-N3)-methyltransferase
MRITVAAVGRAKAGPARDLYDFYAGRLGRQIHLREVEERRRLGPERLKEREAELLLAAVPPGALVVALDERGKALTSAGFANLLGGWRDGGVQDVAFLIGGAEGLSDSATRRADLVLSLGSMTWPHLLVRALLLEQLYRAQCILRGHPYHRE